MSASRVKRSSIEWPLGDHSLTKRAAHLSGMNWGTFVRSAALREARRVLGELRSPSPAQLGAGDLPDLTGGDPHANDNNGGEPGALDTGGAGG